MAVCAHSGPPAQSPSHPIYVTPSRFCQPSSSLSQLGLDQPWRSHQPSPSPPWQLEGEQGGRSSPARCESVLCEQFVRLSFLEVDCNNRGRQEKTGQSKEGLCHQIELCRFLYHLLSSTGFHSTADIHSTSPVMI